jgi:hypothetical protein
MTLRIDTSYQLEETTIVGQTLPSVYFDKIIIQKMNNTFFLKAKNEIEDSQKSPSGEFLKIDMNLVLKDIYNGKNSTWFKNIFDKKLKSKIKVVVAQTTNETSTNLWGSLTDLSQVIDISKGNLDNLTKGLREGTTIQIFSLEELIGSQDKDSITERFSEPFSIPNGTLYSFNKYLSFPSKQNTIGNTKAILIPENQNHLCYTAFTYYEDSFVKSGPLSKITQEYVIKDGNVVRESSVFTTKNEGKIWTGPVHYHNGDVQVNGQPYVGFMGGSNHNSSVFQPTLDRTIVKNSTIHDLRSLNILEDNILFKKPVESNKQEQESVLKNSIFSDLFTSKGANGTIDFSFAINMNSLVKSKFLNGVNLKDESIRKMMNYINIKSVKVFRIRTSRPKPPEDENFTSSKSKIFNPIHKVTKLQSSKIDKKRNTATKTNKVGIGYKKVSNKMFLIDDDRELIIEANNTNGSLITSLTSGDGKSSIEIRDSIYTEQQYSDIIYMTGTDNTIKEVNKQYFQYELEIIFEDNRSDYFRKLKLDIDQQVEKIKKISQVSSISKNPLSKKESYVPSEKSNVENLSLFDVSINKFTNSFIRDISFSNKIVNVSGDYWDEVPVVYLNAFDALNYNEIPLEDLENASMTIRNMLNPISGDPEGYERVIKMLNKMSDALSRNILLSRKNYGSKNQKNLVSKSKASKNNNNPLFNEVKINHIFKEATINTDTPKFFGNFFFKMNEQELSNETSGIRIISYEQFIEYKNAEMEKIYSSPNADISISTLPDAQMNLDLTSYAYFTPSIVYNKKKKPDCIESVLSFGENYVDMVVNSLTTKENVNLKSDLGKSGKTPLERSTNELNGKLKNLFSIKYNVSVSTQESEYNVFKPSVSKKDLKSPSINDIGGKLKNETVVKKSAAKETSNSTTVLRSLLNTKLVLKEERPKVNQFNPNVLSTDCDEPAQVVSTLPNQLKSLVIAQDGNKNLSFSPNPGIRSDVISLIRSNPFSNSDTSYTAKNLFENIVTVQYLSGYETNSNNSISIKDEKWKILTREVFESARESGRKLFCRLIPYSNTRFNIYYDRKLPIIDPYFYIGDTEENAILEAEKEPVVQTRSLSMTFDNPQYQFTYFAPPATNPGGEQRSRLSSRVNVPQNLTVATNVSTPIIGSGGGSSY